MSWIVLVLSGFLETVWAAALAESKSLSRLTPSIVFVVSVSLSMLGLGYALRSIPLGTGYAVWVGIGTVGNVLYGMAVLGDPVTLVRILCLSLILAGVVGLRIVG